MIDSKFSEHRLKEIEQVRIFIEKDGKKIILADTWRIKRVYDPDNSADGICSGIYYPQQYPNSEIHVEVSVLCGLWIRLW